MGIPRHRSRLLTAAEGTNVLSNNLVGPYSQSKYSFKGKEETLDENHLWRDWRRFTKDRPELQTVDIGGDFTHAKATIEEPGPYVDLSLPTGYRDRFQGRLFAAHLTLDYVKNPAPWLPPGLQSDSEMDRLGTTAISKVAPTNPHVDLATTFGELYRDGLPALPGLQSKRDGLSPSGLGGEHLNIQFGVLPLASDIKKILNTARHAERLIKQFLRDSGRIVRRRYDFPNVVSSFSETLETGKYPVGGPTVTFYSTPGTLIRDVETTTKTWFSGAFTYYADPRLAGRIGSLIQVGQHLTGLKADYESAYNLAPWSWAIDWFTNLGDVINNVSMLSSDGLIMRWGYVMRQTTQKVTYRLEGCHLKDGTEVTADQVLELKHQRRRRATPYGFGLTEEDFTPRQWAILAALGLAQGGRLKSM